MHLLTNVGYLIDSEQQPQPIFHIPSHLLISYPIYSYHIYSAYSYYIYWYHITTPNYSLFGLFPADSVMNSVAAAKLYDDWTIIAGCADDDSCIKAYFGEAYTCASAALYCASHPTEMACCPVTCSTNYSVWHPATDQMAGTQAYGNYSADYNSNATFSIPFLQMQCKVRNRVCSHFRHQLPDGFYRSLTCPHSHIYTAHTVYFMKSPNASFTMPSDRNSSLHLGT